MTKYLVRELYRKHALKTVGGEKIKPDRTKMDKEGLGIKYSKVSINFLGANCRSINNKQSSISDILEIRRFHGIAVYIRNHLKGHVYRIQLHHPDSHMEKEGVSSRPEHDEICSHKDMGVQTMSGPSD